MLENDREKRRLRLGLKQLMPTSLDEYIAEHKEGDEVTGRVAEVNRNRATVELGEGVQAICTLARTGAEAGTEIGPGRCLGVFIHAGQQMEGQRRRRQRPQRNPRPRDASS